MRERDLEGLKRILTALSPDQPPTAQQIEQALDSLHQIERQVSRLREIILGRRQYPPESVDRVVAVRGDAIIALPLSEEA